MGTPLLQVNSPCVLPVVFRLWASLRLGHLKKWVQGWVPRSIFSLGTGVSSVVAWFSTALDIEEVLAQIGGDQLHVMVADVRKSFDTMDAWFRKVYFSYHSQVRLRFKLASGLAEPWCREIPQGCALRLVFTVVLYVPWCMRLEAMPAVRPQLYADNVK